MGEPWWLQHNHPVKNIMAVDSFGIRGAFRVQCPYCGAGIGELCRRSGSQPDQPHVGREQHFYEVREMLRAELIKPEQA
jgi:hypothetical protein